jgi:hypothetical protein
MAKGIEKPPCEVSYRDSVLLEKDSHILSTVLRLRNSLPLKIDLGLQLQFPPKWRPIGKMNPVELASFSLKAGEEKIVPITLLRVQGVMAGWGQIKVRIWTKGLTDTTTYTINLHVSEKPGFNVVATDPEKFFSGENPGTLPIAVHLKNTGNMPDRFRITGSASSLSFQYQDEVELQPGQDTTILNYLKIKKAAWRELSRETIPLSVTSQFSGNNQQAYFKIRKVSSVLNLPRPARKEIPITLGGGLLVNGNRITYFGQFSTSYKFGKHTIGFSYRSKDMGTALNSYQVNAFNLTYNYKNFQLLAGQVQIPKNFFTFGQGVSIQYRKVKTAFSISAVKHNNLYQGFTNRSYVNDNIYAAAEYRIKKVAVSQQLESNFNNVFGLNSYLFHNEAVVLSNDQTKLRLFGGVGMEEKTRATDSLMPYTYGWAGGYEVATQYRKWRINSAIRYRSSNYPGIFQGIHYESHELLRNIGKFYVGPILYYNGLERSTLRDTLYNSDYLTINSLKTGLTAGGNFERLSFHIGFGQLRQIGRVYNYGAAQYADFQIQAKLFDKTDLQISTNNAFVPVGDKTLFSTNAQFQVSGNKVGFSAFYNKIPNVVNEAISLYETVFGGPTYTQTFFARKLALSLRYSFAKTLSEENVRHGIGAQINFNSASGINLGITGFYPLKDPARTDLPITETRSGRIYFTQRIGIRTGKKTELDLKVILFTDANNNQICDSGETRVSNVFFSINDEMMLTDRAGTVKCQHLRRGLVTLNFLSTKLGGLIPATGVLQSMELGDDETIYVAFKEGKKVTGNVVIQNDSMSHSSMTADNLKIIITDELGAIYYALTDRSGNFSCFIPEGNYKVSLNPEIFKGSDFTPHQVYFNADLRQKKEEFVSFLIVQNKRKIRFLKSTD